MVNSFGISDLVRFAAVRQPDSPAVLFGDRVLTYADLYERVCRLANGLSQLAGAGDRVAILAENLPEYIEAYYGVPAAGMGLTFLNYRLNPRELEGIVADAGASVVITEPKYLDTVTAIRDAGHGLKEIVCVGEAAGTVAYDDLVASSSPDEPSATVDERDLAWLIYTSGTTGRPKGAMISHLNLLSAVANTVATWERAAEAVSLFPWPLCHVAGYSVLVTHTNGRPLVLMRGYDPQAFLEHVQRYRVTDFSVAPTMLSMLLRHPGIDDFDLSSVERIGYGAAPMPIEVLKAAMARFPGARFATGFGMTELGGNILYQPPDAHLRALEGRPDRLASVGRPMPFSAVRVVDDAMNDVAVGDVGELVVRGPQVTGGYWGNPEASAEAFAGGWFHSGDLARMDEEGNFYIVDRKKDMIITGGENVYSREVEEIIYRHPAVAEAAVVGVPDQTWGENVVAVVQLRAGQEAGGDEIIGICRENLAGYKKPKAVYFVDELPKNAAGKILKRELRRMVVDEELT